MHLERRTKMSLFVNESTQPVRGRPNNLWEVEKEWVKSKRFAVHLFL